MALSIGTRSYRKTNGYELNITFMVNIFLFIMLVYIHSLVDIKLAENTRTLTSHRN